MGDRNDHVFFEKRQQLVAFQSANDEVQSELIKEKVAAEKQALIAEAYRQMPADMRARAKEWGVEALMELVWLNGWDCGYRQSMRDRAVLERSEG